MAGGGGGGGGGGGCTTGWKSSSIKKEKKERRINNNNKKEHYTMSQIVLKLFKKEEFTSKFRWTIAGAGFHLESNPSFTFHRKKEYKCTKNNHNSKHVVSSSGKVYFVVSTHTHTYIYQNINMY